MQLNGNAIQKIMFVAFFTLTAFALSTDILPRGYFLTQSLIIALCLWSLIVTESTEPIYMLSFITAISIVLDAVIIGVSWNHALISADSKYSFSMAMAIICLLLKPVFVLINVNLARQKEGQSALISGPTFGDWANSSRQQPNNTNSNSSTTFGGGYQQQS